MDEAPNYPTLTWHLLENGTHRTVCTGVYWEPPESGEYPDTPRELCVACHRTSVRRMAEDAGEEVEG